MHVNVRDIVHRTSAPMTQATSNLIQKIILEEEELHHHLKVNTFLGIICTRASELERIR